MNIIISLYNLLRIKAMRIILACKKALRFWAQGFYLVAYRYLTYVTMDPVGFDSINITKNHGICQIRGMYEAPYNFFNLFKYFISRPVTSIIRCADKGLINALM